MNRYSAGDRDAIMGEWFGHRLICMDIDLDVVSPEMIFFRQAIRSVFDAQIYQKGGKGNG
jgi:hypothetical protein